MRIASRPSQRAAQKAATRERILDGFIAQLAGGGTDFSIERLATSVGVSTRTVYFHFPDREALLTALDERLNRVLLYQPEYSSPTDFVDKAAQEMRDAAANADLVRAQLNNPLGRDVRTRSRSRRAARVRRALAPVLGSLPPGEAREKLAVFLLLRGLDSFKVLHEDLGLSGDQCARAVRWALTALIADLEARTAKK